MVNIKKEVQKLIRKHKSRNPFIIAKNMGITVKCLDLSPKCPKGMFKKILRRKFIIINMTRVNNDAELNTIMAHELGHAILHSSSSAFFLHDHTYYARGKFEREANLFAAELLIDTLNIDTESMQNYSLFQLASTLNVPMELLKYKFNIL